MYSEHWALFHFQPFPVASAFSFLLITHTMDLLTAHFGFCPPEPTSSLLMPLPHPPPNHSCPPYRSHLPKVWMGTWAPVIAQIELEDWAAHPFSCSRLENLSELVLTLLGFNQNKKHQLFVL